MPSNNLYCYRPPTSSTVNQEGKKDKNAAAVPETPDTVVLLADSPLLELPLEALDMFESHHILSMSRDLSLQMLYHRFYEEQLTRTFYFLVVLSSWGLLILDLSSFYSYFISGRT